MFDLRNKIAVVTGGGSGIGRATAILFAEQGAHTIVIDVDEKSGASVADDIAKKGGVASFYKCDISRQADVREVIRTITESHPAIDILVNNAGISHIGNAEATGENDFDKMMNVNVKGAYNCLNAVLPAMKRTGGAILNLASVASSVGLTDRFAYSATKGAIVGMTLSVAKDYLPYKIRCNCISPGRVHTPFVDGFIQSNYPGKEKETFDILAKTQPIGRMGKPEEIATLILYLCSDEAAFITGSDYPIDGGLITLST